MAMPALRQPKPVLCNKKIFMHPDKKYVIVTLKGERKLVVSADSYNGILSIGRFYKCLFCDTLLEREQEAAKETHIRSENHGKNLDKHPHVEEFSHNLIRKLTENSTYCTVCNVIVDNIKLMKHICTEVHLQELERAESRALTYKAYK